MTTLEHDGVASLKVEYRRATGGTRSAGRPRGWCVIRTCPCHWGERVTLAFENRWEAERALRVLDADARRYG